MEEKRLFVIAQFDGETQRRLSGLYDILRSHGFSGRQTKNAPYHFTLGSRPPDQERRLIEEIGKTTEIKPIDICLGYIGVFGLNVLFIAPNMNIELLRLQSGFFGDCGSGCHPWAAHATLLMDEPEAIFRALPLVAENFTPFDARIDSVALYEYSPARFAKIMESRLCGA